MPNNISSYSITPASNTTINSINIAEGCNPSGINDAIRQLMADIATVRRLINNFTPYAQTVPNMTISLAAGHVLSGTTLTEVAIQTTTTFTAPVSTSRIDRVVISSTTGVYSVVTGTASASPVAPAIPTGYYPVAQVLLTSTSTSITDSMITDERDFGFSGANLVSLNLQQTWTKSQSGAIVQLTDAATITPDFSLANNFAVQLAGNRTLANPTNMTAGQSGQISIYQDSTGSRTLAYGWGFVFPNGTVPSLSTTALYKDELCYDVQVYNTATVTITIATPAVISWTAHGLKTGDRIQLTTTGTLPTGLTASTTYFVVYIDANSFNLATSLANAATATKIATSGSQSGVHTATAVTINANLVKGFA